MLSTDAAMGKMCEIQFFDLQQCLSKYTSSQEHAAIKN